MTEQTVPSASDRSDRLLLDEYLPTFEVTQIQHAVVDGAPAEAYDRLRRLDFMSSRLVRALVKAQAVPDRISRRLHGREQLPGYPRHATLDDMLATDAWVLLVEDPGREMVLGLLWPLGGAGTEIPKVTPQQWTAFAQPGYAKVAWSLAARPYGTERALLTSEARTQTTDPATSRRFRLIWRGLAPFAALLKRRMLDMVEAAVKSAPWNRPE
jgi:hypothetical protein